MTMENSDPRPEIVIPFKTKKLWVGLQLLCFVTGCRQSPRGVSI